MNLDSELKWFLHGQWLNVDDSVNKLYNEPTKINYNELAKQLRLLYLYEQALIEGLSSFSFAYAHEHGWLCYNDYMIFDELEPHREEVRKTWFKRK